MVTLTNKQIANFESKIIRSTDTECWLWGACFDSKGYGQFHTNEGMRKSHRISYELYKEQIPAGILICHTCDNPPCVNPEHLWLGTNQDNMTDMVKKGRKPSGEDSFQHKLTAKQVLEIRKLYDIGLLNQKEAAIHYGVKSSVINCIAHRKTWKHIEQKNDEPAICLIHKNLASRLKYLRFKNGKGLLEVAAGAPIANGYLSQIENGKKPYPKQKIIERLAKYYGVTREFLTDGRLPAAD